MMDQLIVREVPEALWKFLGGNCRMDTGALRILSADSLPETPRQLLVHQRDMTSTLAAFHGSRLRVEILQQHQLDPLYLREVFLRTLDGDRIVEYGVIAVALDLFTSTQQAAIHAGETPLGGLLHQFQIPFTSAPMSFFSVSPEGLARTPLAAAARSIAFGRFNCLTKPSGEPLAWIMEILPPASA